MRAYLTSLLGQALPLGDHRAWGSLVQFWVFQETELWGISAIAWAPVLLPLHTLCTSVDPRLFWQAQPAQDSELGLPQTLSSAQAQCQGVTFWVWALYFKPPLLSSLKVLWTPRS